MKRRLTHDMNSALTSLSLALDLLEDEPKAAGNLAPLMKEKVEQLRFCWDKLSHFDGKN